MEPKIHKGLLATGTLSLSMLFAGCTSTSLINDTMHRIWKAASKRFRLVAHSKR